MAKLEKLHDLAGEKMPSARLGAECSMLVSQVAIALENGPLALRAADFALDRLQNGNEKYNPATRAYLVAYCRALVNYCLVWRDKDEHIPIANDLSGIDRKAVWPGLLKSFPLPPDGSFTDGYPKPPRT